MKKYILSLLLAGIAAIAFTGCATAHHSAAWDYKIVEGNHAPTMEAELSRLGSDGWVVVSSSSTVDANSTSPKVVVILKHHK
jgi:hypothetical protein